MGITQEFIETIQTYATTDKKTLARYFLKKTVNVGEAVVNIIGATGIAGFKFHVPETESIKFENEITDHYIDTNTAIQDHIAEKPIVITMQGLVGEYFYSVNEIEDLLALVTPTISLVKQFIPQFRDVFKAIKARTTKKTVTLNKGTNTIQYGATDVTPLNYMDLFSLYQSLYKVTTAQTRAFLFFEALWKGRVPFSVETTWKRYDNMVVQSLEPRRDNNADITEFTITFKQISFANTKTETKEQYYNRVAQQKAETINKGVEKGEQISITDTGVLNV